MSSSPTPLVQDSTSMTLSQDDTFETVDAEEAVEAAFPELQKTPEMTSSNASHTIPLREGSEELAQHIFSLEHTGCKHDEDIAYALEVILIRLDEHTVQLQELHKETKTKSHDLDRVS